MIIITYRSGSNLALFRKKIVGEEKKSQLQPVVFSDANESIATLKKSQINRYDELESYKLLRKKRVKKAFIRMAVWLLVVLFIPVFVFFSIVIINPNAGHNFFGYTFFIVSSESMKPVFDVNDCIIVKSSFTKEEVTIGSDITFVRESDGQVVTHRVIDTIEKENGVIEYITRGVHNAVADSGSVAFEDIIGIRVATVSWLGQTVMFFRTPYGIITFLAIFVVVMLVIYYSFKLSDDIRAVGLK